SRLRKPQLRDGRGLAVGPSARGARCPRPTAARCLVVLAARRQQRPARAGGSSRGALVPGPREAGQSRRLCSRGERPDRFFAADSVSDQAPSPEAQQARASSVDGGGSASAAHAPGRQAQRRYQTQRKKRQRMIKKKIRRGQILVSTAEPPPVSAAPTSAEGATLLRANGEVRAREPGCERKRDGEQVLAEVTCSLSAPACDLLPETRWFGGRRFGEGGAVDTVDTTEFSV
ncbi:unnamed protein product, partial [Prorocentrum cordatum]